LSLTVRPATKADAAAILAIYAPYILETPITFEEELPSLDSFAARIAPSPLYPWLAAERDGTMLGYAYASIFKDRPAYRWSVETTVYVAREAHRQGVGAALYTRLLAELEALGYVNAIAVITASNAGSIVMHERFGFREVGRWPQIGFKHGAWHDTIILQRELAPRRAPPPELGRNQHGVPLP
jgi:phosphinothricin acetyltransferase